MTNVLSLKYSSLLSAFAALLFIVVVLSLMVGAFSISPLSIVAILISPITSLFGNDLSNYYTNIEETVFWNIRMPRVVLGILVGISLAVAGAAMQGLFRNPLADPGLIGVSSGAAFAAVAVIVFSGSFLGIFTLPISAFIGGVITTLLVYKLSTRNGKTSIPTMLLAGIAIGAIAGAGTGVFTYLADDDQLRTLTFWTMGSLGSATWESIISILPLVVIAMVLLPMHARSLNAFLIGESTSRHLGFDPDKTKKQVILLSALLVGAAVASAGIIGFVGLVVPHLVRLLAGPDHRIVLPGSMLLGAAFMLSADLLARTFVSPSELPIGIIMAIIGGPFFLWLLMNRMGRHSF
ncbi:iron ABC transporter permease [Thiomicrorhabdus hydrogeniphila]